MGRLIDMNWKYRAIRITVIVILLLGGLFAALDVFGVYDCGRYYEKLPPRMSNFVWWGGPPCYADETGSYPYAVGDFTIILPLLLFAIFIRRRMDAWKTKRAVT